MGLSNYLPSSRLIQPGVCTSSTRPASPFEGQVIYETDTNRTLVYDAAAWVIIGNAQEWQSYSPTVTSSGGTITTLGAVSARFMQISKTVFVYFSIAITTAGTASGQLRMTLPVTASSNILSDTIIGSAREQANTGNLMQLFLVNSTTVGMLNYAAGGQFANGNTFRGSITYEAA